MVHEALITHKFYARKWQSFISFMITFSTNSLIVLETLVISFIIPELQFRTDQYIFLVPI